MMPLLLSVSAAACVMLPAAADMVAARDLASVLPWLAGAREGVEAGFAPAPGVRRVFSPAELNRIGARLGVAGEASAPVCVERETAPLDPERLLEVMRRSLPEARIEIESFSRYPAPTGEVVFPRAALQSSGLWTGWVRYGKARRFAVWARVRARVSRTEVVAAAPLRAGQIIGEGQVRLRTAEVPPGARPGGAGSLADVVGRVPRRAIPAGSAVPRAWLAEPPEVRRGEAVTVEVRQGAAFLELQARAESDGRRGERIALLNPETHRRFQARVEGKGRAVAGEGAGSSQ